MHALSSTGQLGEPGRITIVDRGSALLGQFSSKAHDYAMSKLTEAGADVKLETGVAVHPDHVEFADGSKIAARTVVWGGGESSFDHRKLPDRFPGEAVVWTSSPI